MTLGMFRWSADRKRIYFVRDGGVWVFTLANGRSGR